MFEISQTLLPQFILLTVRTVLPPSPPIDENSLTLTGEWTT